MGRSQPHHRKSCWCDDCRRDVQQRHSLAAQQRNRESRSAANAHYERWTDEDLEYLRTNLHLDTKAQAEQLGRTIASVQSARKRFGLKPRG